MSYQYRPIRVQAIQVSTVLEIVGTEDGDMPEWFAKLWGDRIKFATPTCRDTLAFFDGESTCWAAGTDWITCQENEIYSDLRRYSDAEFKARFEPAPGG